MSHYSLGQFARPTGSLIQQTGALLCGLCLFMATGCDKPQNVTQYRVLKPRILLEQNHATSAAHSRPPAPAHPARTVPARMIAAIVPQQTQSWFFKVTGPVDAVEGQMAPFLAFIKSVRFAEGTRTPTWTLPEGWTVLPAGSQQSSGPIRIKRFATIQVGSADRPLTLAVTSLPGPGENSDQYVLVNVNRWRRQLGLPPLTQATLYDHNTRTQEVRKIKAGDVNATLVNLVGQRAETGMPAGHPPSAGSGSAPRKAARKTGVPTYKVPKGWKPGKVGGFRKAAFQVTDKAKQVEITVIDLRASDLTANINRWRRQVGLQPATAQAIGKQVKTINIGKLKGQYVELIGPAGSPQPKTILGVIVLQGRTAWFIKLTGDSDLAQREKSRFESFAQSLRFP